jgi:hypothetical protein
MLSHGKLKASVVNNQESSLMTYKTFSVEICYKSVRILSRFKKPKGKATMYTLVTKLFLLLNIK